MQPKNGRKDLSLLKGNWSAAEVRLSYVPLKNTPIAINSPSDVYQVFMYYWDRDLIHIQEQVSALYVNEKQGLLGHRLISTGKTTQSYLDIGMLFGVAWLYQAKYFFLAHNHPYGTLEPSEEDIKLTHYLRQIGEIHNVELLDHIILSDEGYVSLADNGTKYCRN